MGALLPGAVASMCIARTPRESAFCGWWMSPASSWLSRCLIAACPEKYQLLWYNGEIQGADWVLPDDSKYKTQAQDPRTDFRKCCHHSQMMIALPADANENKSLFSASKVHRHFATTSNDTSALHCHSEPDESGTRAKGQLGARQSINGRKKTD